MEYAKWTANTPKHEGKDTWVGRYLASCLPNVAEEVGVRWFEHVDRPVFILTWWAGIEPSRPKVQ